MTLSHLGGLDGVSIPSEFARRLREQLRVIGNHLASFRVTYAKQGSSFFSQCLASVMLRQAHQSWAVKEREYAVFHRTTDTEEHNGAWLSGPSPG